MKRSYLAYWWRHAPPTIWGERLLAGILLGLLAFSHGLLYAAAALPWQAPDEPRHFEHVRLVYDTGRPVTEADISLPLEGAIITSMDRYQFWRLGRFVNPRLPTNGSLPRRFEEIWYPGEYQPGEANLAHLLNQPPTYYLVTAAWLHLFPTNDVTTQLYLARLLSVLFSTGVILLAYLTVITLRPWDRFSAFIVPTFIALLPTHAYMSAIVNSDVMAEFLAALVFFLTARLLVARSVKLPDILTLLLALIIAIATKRTTVFLVPAVVLALAWRFWPRRWLQQPTLKRALLPVATGGVIGFFLLWQSGFLQDLSQSIGGDALAGELFLHPGRYLVAPFEGFWGRFGWLNINLPPLWYAFPGLLCAVALIGLVGSLWRTAPEDKINPALVAFSLIAIAFSLGLNIANAAVANANTIWVVFVPQGRYLFAAVIPISLLLVLGWRDWIPPRWRTIAIAPVLLTLFIWDIAVLFGVVFPGLYG